MTANEMEPIFLEIKRKIKKHFYNESDLDTLILYHAIASNGKRVLARSVLRQNLCTTCPGSAMDIIEKWIKKNKTYDDVESGIESFEFKAGTLSTGGGIASGI